MSRKTARILGLRQTGDLITVRIEDIARNIYYKGKSNIHDKRKIKEILETLKAFDVDINEIMRLPPKEEKKKKKEEGHWW